MKKIVELQTVPIERTLAKYLNIIFAPAPASKEKPRVKTWQTRDTSANQPVRAQLALLDTFKPTDVRVLLALFVIYWKTPANPDGTHEFTLQQVAHGRLAWNGGHGDDSTPQRLKKTLLRLRFNGLLLSNVYRDGQSGGFIRDTATFTILDKLRVVERIPGDKGTGRPQDEYADLKSRFRFHKTITAALENREIKLMFVQHLLNIDPRAEAALLAALYLDAVLADKTAWQRGAQALISEDLQLTGDYPRPRDRKKVLERIVRHLDGFPISTGVLHLQIELTKDRRDYKLVVSKTALPALVKPFISPARALKRPAIAETAQKPAVGQIGGRTGYPYNLTEEQEGRAGGLAAHIREIIGQPKNQGAYFKLAAEAIRDGYEPILHRCLGLTKEAMYDQRVRTTPSQFLHDLMRREREKGSEAAAA